MAPMKSLRSTALVSRNTVTTRSKSTTTSIIMNDVRGKRKAEEPAKEPSLKRSAFGDVTNATNKNKLIDNKKTTKTIKQTATTTTTTTTVAPAVKKVAVQLKTLPALKTITKPETNSIKTVTRSSIQNENLAPPPAPVVTTRASLTNRNAGKSNQTALKPKESLKDITNVSNKVKTRLSNEFEKTEESSLYSSALEDMNESKLSKANSSEETLLSAKGDMSPEHEPSNMTVVAEQMENKLNLGDHVIPEGVDDFDKENWDDIFQVSHYAMDIFNYLKSREDLFTIPDYMDRQVCLTRWMRSLLVDWMVEIQESFELNHETLYLGVKLVDMYLGKMTVSKETLQLVGAAAMFIASKYDERLPPPIEDFLYICDGAYTRKELVRMEINLLKVCDFNLGIPISYRFLRRYARCAKITMPILTLARYILEYSLMDYSIVTLKDSIVASAALYLALQMKKISGWTPTLQFYTGYKLTDIISTVYLLNNIISKKPKEQLMTVHNKYSHKIFYEVATTPTITNEEIQV